MLKKLIAVCGSSIVLLINNLSLVNAEWIKDQQGKWVYFENNSKVINYSNGQNFAESIELFQYYQADARWADKRYGLSNLKISGCGPTALSMIISKLKEDVTPVQVADYIYNMTMEMNTTFIGTSSLGAKSAILYWGLNYKVIDSKDELVEALKRGNLVYSAVGHGIFVNGYGTHAVILSGYINGKTKAVDPDNMYKTNRWYSVDDIWNERSLELEDNAVGGAFMEVYK